MLFRSLGHAEADFLDDALEDVDREFADEDAFADAGDEVADDLRRGVAEEAVEHLLAGEAGLLAECAGDVGDHLRLDFPDADDVGG